MCTCVCVYVRVYVRVCLLFTHAPNTFTILLTHTCTVCSVAIVLMLSSRGIFFLCLVVLHSAAGYWLQ